ncbi:hypothetical protein OHB41_51460 [Streptomyces sp. NBC_01571]|nr:hypothetical protein [Streptomyces sp. NBC_01571]MCX4581378.1 hypothetical protein [Streptomyces sp. NBC_01571]
MDAGEDLTFEEWCAELEAMDHQEYLEVMAQLDVCAADPTS